MNDSTTKPTTLRSATATGRIEVTTAGVALIRSGPLDERDVVESARVAGLMAVKQLPFWLPYRPGGAALDTRIGFVVGDDAVSIEATVETISATGVEMEALAAVSAAALCIYDMLVAHVGMEMEIGAVRLDRERGGRTQYAKTIESARAVVIVLSDSVASGSKPDTAGRAVADGLERAGFEVAGYDVLPDEPAELEARIRSWLVHAPDLIVTVGGTGVGPRDRTVEVVSPLLTMHLPGLMEAARAFGQARTPYAMLSRGVAGLNAGTVIATFPGSRRGAEETLEAVLDGLIHLIDVLHVTQPHDGGYT